MNRLVAIDPGRMKCGLVLVDLEEGRVLKGKVVRAPLVLDVLRTWQKEKPLEEMVLGNGTSSSEWEDKLRDLAPLKLVEEQGTTLRARERYWELWPPDDWFRWVPRGLVLPPYDLDAVAALVLLEDYLEMKFIWPGSPSFRI